MCVCVCVCVCVEVGGGGVKVASEDDTMNIRQCVYDYIGMSRWKIRLRSGNGKH